MLLGALLLLTLVTGLSLLVRHSFVALSALAGEQRQMDHAVAALAAAQASLAREQILVERSLLHLPSAPVPAAAFSPAPAPRERDIHAQSERAEDRLMMARNALRLVPDAPRLDAELAEHSRVLSRLRHLAPDLDARMLSARLLEPIDSSLTQKLRSLQDRHELMMARLTLQREGLRARLIGACGACIVMAVLLLAAMIFYTLLPLRLAARAARRVGKGDLQLRIDWPRSDELGAIATEFNRLAIRLRDLRETESGRREMEYQLSDAVVQSIFEPVIVTDGRGQILRLNKSARELLGDAADNRTGLTRTPGGEQILAAIHSAVSLQQSVGGEGETALAPLRIGESGRNYRLRATPIRDNEGHLLGAVTVLEDVTELQEVDRFKTRFLAIASKKLRDPLEKLRIAIHALSRGYAGELRSLQSDVLEGARSEAQRMDDLMADLFAVAELDSGHRTLDRKALRPLDLLREAQASIRTEAMERSVTVEVEAPADLRRVEADRRALRSVFENLLTNALRYTPSGGSIRLTAIESEGVVQFSVADTGDGIGPERLTRIFGRFNSGEGEGSGLGLALVRRLIEAHGGRVSVESRLQAGTTFSFTLPMAAEAETRHPVEAG